MKKLIIIITIFISSFLKADQLEELEVMFSTNRLQSMPDIAKDLSIKGTFLHSKGEYLKAIEFYKSSLMIREQIGLEKSNGYATVLFLLSIAEHKSGNSCSSLSRIKKVITLYYYLGKTEEARIAEEEGLKIFDINCNKFISLN